jgi:hypothetical protein
VRSGSAVRLSLIIETLSHTYISPFFPSHLDLSLAMSDTEQPPRTTRLPHYKTHIDWAALFAEVQQGESCSRVVAPRTLQERYKAWTEAKARGDVQHVAVASGKIDCRRYSRTALGFCGDLGLAEPVRALKQADKPVDRTLISTAAAELWRELHPHVLRSSRTFVISRAVQRIDAATVPSIRLTSSQPSTKLGTACRAREELYVCVCAVCPRQQRSLGDAMLICLTTRQLR